MKRGCNFFCFISIIVFSCINNKNNRNIDHSITIIPKDNKVFYFEPSKSSVYGLLTMQEVYGPPNYGENPEIDEKETIYLLNLDKPITLLLTDTNDKLNEKMENITSFQIVGKNLDQFRNKIGTKITLEGSFSSAISGHHHTNVIFNINK